MKRFLKSAYGLLFTLMASLLFSTATGVPFLAVSAVSVCIGLVYQIPTGVLGMALTVELWEGDIVKNLFKDNEFLNYAVNADQYVLAGKVVHIPNAGGAPAVQKNRSSLPATITKRTDVDITYSLDEFTSDPIKIENADAIELSYDKRQDCLADSQNAVNETVADWILRAWAPTTAARILRTTGTAIVSSVNATATGNRAKFITADLKKAQKQFNKDGVSNKERYALFSADMLDQLTDSLTETQYRDFSAAYNAQEGVVGKLYGFNIMQRGSTITYTNAATPVPKDPGAAEAATDNDCVLCWQKQSLERAVGQVKFFELIGDPTLYGDVYSTLLRAGGRIRRNDCKGVLAIVQAAAA
jgi:hypothetical protein